MIPPDELALPDEEDLDPGLPAAGSGGDDVEVLRCQVQDLLALVDLLDRVDLVAEYRRPLELQGLRRRFHALGDRLDHAVGLSLKEQGNLFDYLGILPPADCADARADAPVDEIVKARARVCPGNGLCARAEGEQLLEQAQRAPDAAHTGEGTEVAGAVFGHPAGDVDEGVVFLGVDLDKGIALVILQTSVVRRLVLLDQVAFQNHRFLLRLGDDVLEVGDLLDHRADLGR